jgi:hypothetical protein
MEIKMDDKKLEINAYQPDIVSDASTNISQQIDIKKEKIALIILGVCLLLGGLGVFLFDGKTWGLNIPLFSFLLIGSLLLLRQLSEQDLNAADYLLIATVLFFVLMLAWRDSQVLNGLSLLGLLLTMILAYTLGTRGNLEHTYVSETLQDFYLLTRYSINSYSDLVHKDIEWTDVKRRWGQFGDAILRGLIITAILLFVFGYLLSASDARFEAIISQLFNWNLDADKILIYLLSFGITSWIAVAILRGGILIQSSVVNKEPFLPNWKLGTIEIVMILTALNLLFLSFIAVQFTYFFGGDALVQSPIKLTYANYAREGFFQLVTVVILVLTLLLFTHWLYKPSTKFGKMLYPILATSIIIMTMIIEASAAHRMYIYTRVSGLTELRFYSSVFMLWLVILFIWFSMTVLRGQRQRFSFGAILTGMILIGFLHVINPDARIAEFNLARLQDGQSFDVDYVSSLSADALPSLLTAMPELPEKQQCQLWQKLESHSIIQTATENWRGFNLDRYLARNLLLSVSSSPPNCK